MLDRTVEAIGKKSFGKDQPYDQSDQKPGHELSHITLPQHAPPICGVGEAPFLVAESDPGNLAKSRSLPGTLGVKLAFDGA